MLDHHRMMIRFSLDHIIFVEQQVRAIDAEISRKIVGAGLQPAFDLLQSIPDVKHDSAASILAEVGPDMRVFPTAGHLSSWAGVCPGNRPSAGKSQRCGTNRGNRWLRGMLTECAWAAAGKKDGYLKGKFWRIAAQGRKKALVAVAHTLLVLVYQVLSQGKPYQEGTRPLQDETTPASDSPSRPRTWPPRDLRRL